MDKKTILAFLLIGFILLLTQTKFYREKILKLPPQKPAQLMVVDDSTGAKPNAITPTPKVVEREKIEEQSTVNPSVAQESEKTGNENPLAVLLKSAENKPYQDVIIETDNYLARISSKGAVVSSWKLKKYSYNDDEKVQLIQNNGYGNLGISFINDEDTLETYNAYFKPDKYKVRFENGKQQDTVNFVLTLGDNQQIIKKYIFYKDQYIIDLNIRFRELAREFDDQEYFLNWESGLRYTELDYLKLISKEDVNYSKAYVFQGGSKEELKLPNKPYISKTRSDFKGIVDWTAIRTKYFAMIILPDTDYEIETILYGETSPIYQDSKYKDRVKKTFSVRLKNKISTSKSLKNVNQHFRVYIGPLDYFILKKYHSTLAKIMDFGMSIIRPFAKLVLKVFIFLHGLIPNYGVVLIIFAILVKVLVWPLTRKSYSSMHKMQELQPKLNELKEKYGKDPQRLNRETMKLYKEEGVNPVSGCLPQLLQMPLLFAIFIIFRNTIELRDAGFIWWIKDLSAPDTIFTLPFSIPLYGNLINVLPLVMGATMFFQQKMTMKDPKQKAMVYFMPVFFTLLFNSFPSGLNLYYTLFNIFSMVQQRFLPEHKRDQNEPINETKKNVNKKPKKSKKK